jgi:hypothetical protein
MNSRTPEPPKAAETPPDKESLSRPQSNLQNADLKADSKLTFIDNNVDQTKAEFQTTSIKNGVDGTTTPKRPSSLKKAKGIYIYKILLLLFLK